MSFFKRDLKKRELVLCVVATVVIILFFVTRWPVSNESSDLILTSGTAGNTSNIILHDNEVLEQSIKVNAQKLHCIYLYFADNRGHKGEGNEEGKISIALKDVNEKIVVAWEPSIEALREINFAVPLIINEEAKEEYTLVICATGCNDTIAIKTSDCDENGLGFSIEQENFDRQVYYKLSVDAPDYSTAQRVWRTILLIASSLLGICVITFMLAKNADRLCYVVKKIFNHKICFVFLCICFFVLGSIFLVSNVNESYFDESSISGICILEKDQEEKVKLYIDDDMQDISIPVLALSENENAVIHLYVATGSGKKEYTIKCKRAEDFSELAKQLDMQGEQSFFEIHKEYVNLGKLTTGWVELEIVSEYFESNSVFMLGMNGDEVAYAREKKTYIGYWVLLSSVILLLVGSYLVCKSRKRQKPLEYIYAIIAFTLGCVYMILFTPTGTNDTIGHINTVYYYTSQLLESEDIVDDVNFKMTQKDDAIYQKFSFYHTGAKNIERYDTLLEALQSDTYGETSTLRSSLANLCFAPAYIPYIFSFLLGRMLNINFLIVLELARFVGMLLFIMMIVITIKWIPKGKEAIFVFSINPMMIQTMTSISYDLLLVGASFMFFSLAMKLKEENYYIKRSEVLIINLLSLILASSKGGIYLIIAMLYLYLHLIFDKEGRMGLKKHVLYYFEILLVALSMFWSLCYQISTNQANKGSDKYTIFYMFQNIGETIKLLEVSIIEDIDLVLKGAFGGMLGWNTNVLPWFLVSINIILFIYACVIKARYSKENHYVEYVVLLATFLCVYVTFLAGKTVGEITHISGIQGRYFIPIIPFVIYLVPCIKNEWEKYRDRFIQATWIISVIEAIYVARVCIST